MRFVLRALCAAALAGCSDVSQTAAPRRTLTSDAAIDGHPIDARPFHTIDSRPIAQRVEGLFSRRLMQVSIPSDDFSHAPDAVHPDMACPPSKWMGAKCWLLYTPYKNSDPSFENPAFLLESDDSTWATPPEISNPVIGFPGVGYNSDPDHAYDPATGRLVQVYRVVADSFNKIMVMSTSNARKWTTPSLAFMEKNHDAVSPSLIIEPDRLAKLWYVRAGNRGCNATASSVQMRTAMPSPEMGYEHVEWSAATPVELAIPGYVIWHLDVLELGPGKGYLAMIAAFPKGWDCANGDIWLASSQDGIKWQAYAVPVLWRTMAAAKDRFISTWYRGTMRYDAATDVLDMWPSAMSRGRWNVYHLSVKLSDALLLLRQAEPPDRANMATLSRSPAPAIMP